MLIAPGRCSSSYSSGGRTRRTARRWRLAAALARGRSWSASVLPEHVAEDDTSCFCRFRDCDRCAVDLRVLTQVALRVLGGLEKVEHVAAAAEARPLATDGAGKHNRIRWPP